MKNFKIIELMELFDEGEVTTASEMQRPQQALDREMFQDANKRLNKAGGGRIGFAEGDRGKGQYKRDSLSNTEQKKIKEALSKNKLDFD